VFPKNVGKTRDFLQKNFFQVQNKNSFAFSCGNPGNVAIIDLMTDKAPIPLGKRVWNKADPIASIQEITLLKQWWSSDEVALAYGMTRQGLNKKIRETKKAALHEQDGATTTPDEDAYRDQSQ
jgi:hypothetical protein